MKFVYAEGATLFNKDDAGQLIPKHMTTQSQLNEWEEANIIKAERWLLSRRKNDLLTVEFIKALHLKMFNETWLWAGKFRHHQTNIGVASFEIWPSLKTLLEDLKFWIDHDTFSPDEIAIRLHHRLVFIHPFPNGNGRHARLMTDAFLVKINAKRFSWGSINLSAPSETRSRYINALRKADQGDYDDLLAWVRS